MRAIRGADIESKLSFKRLGGMNMREVDGPMPSALTKRGPLLALGAAGVVGLLILAVVIVLQLIKGGDPSAVAQRTPSAPRSNPATTQAPLPTVSARPATVQLLKSRVLFGVQSVGSDITAGVRTAFSRAHLSKPKVMNWKKALAIKGPLVATANIGRNGDPTSKLRAFAGIVNDAPRGSVTVALMAFNFQDVTAQTDVPRLFDAYVETMDSVEGANPDITFLYTTAPVTTANSWRAVDQRTVRGLGDVDQPVWQDNIARERLNSSLRERYGSTGRLFDIAALQARIAGDKVAAKVHEEQWYYVMNPGLSTDGKRLNEAGSVRLARELMLLVSAATKD